MQKGTSLNESVRVIVRCRPLNEKEKKEGSKKCLEVRDGSLIQVGAFICLHVACIYFLPCPKLQHCT